MTDLGDSIAQSIQSLAAKPLRDHAIEFLQTRGNQSDLTDAADAIAVQNSSLSQSNKGDEGLQRSDYRSISQMGMGLMAQLIAAIE